MAGWSPTPPPSQKQAMPEAFVTPSAGLKPLSGRLAPPLLSINDKRFFCSEEVKSPPRSYMTSIFRSLNMLRCGTSRDGSGPTSPYLGSFPEACHSISQGNTDDDVIAESTVIPRTRSKQWRSQKVTDSWSRVNEQGARNFRPNHPMMVLESMISSMDQQGWSRYRSYLSRERKALIAEMWEKISTEAWAVLESGDYSRERPVFQDNDQNGSERYVCISVANMNIHSLLEIGRNPDKRGIYLHIIWVKRNTKQIWLYVGQSAEMPTRIANYRDSKYRKLNPSLHYFVLDFGKGNQD